MPDIKKIVGRRINAALAMSNTKQKELASALGVTDNTISYFCSGSRTPNLHQLAAIADYFNMSADYLLGLSNDPERDPAATDDLGISAKAVKKIHNLQNCSSADREYMEFLSQFLESALFDRFIYDLYMRCQVNIAEIVYNSTWTDSFDPSDTTARRNRNKRILDLANSGKYNSAVSGYLRQMVRFDQEQDKLDEENDFSLDCNLSKDIVPQIVEMNTLSTFEALKSDLCRVTSLRAEGKLREDCL